MLVGDFVTFRQINVNCFYSSKLTNNELKDAKTP